MKRPLLITPFLAASLLGAALASSSGVASAASANMNLGNPQSQVKLSESGSSLLEPHLVTIQQGFQKAYPNVQIEPSAGGSGKGISDAIAGVVQMGGTDAYLPPADFQQYPSIENIPIAVSSQSVDYNLPGIRHLKLTGPILAQIYMGKITSWDDAAIKKLNPGVNLPAETIVPIHRSDSSGDTFLFTSFLSSTYKAWAEGPAFNTSVTWPTVQGELTASGNTGMVQATASTKGSVAYIGISAQSAANTAHLGQSELKNHAGNFVLPTKANVTSAVNEKKGQLPNNLALSLIYAKGAHTYPIVNFEYLVVKPPASTPSVAQGIRDFLAYAINTKQGSSPENLAAQNFVALPHSVIPKVEAAIAKIH
ncbi:MAG: phosphate ABC transporter substrate-binding protein PstS [Acidimicrobiaceae bacterium]|nr:phosphate ABC transporter substrate-binding protein PstS [Acidimicrobiaceae bacterium]MBO0747982.1 phosphate ABC transporter substrate-binding protein PstS [Acidimicrobiaceae bacterium]